MKLAQLVARAAAQYHFWRAAPPRFNGWSLSLRSPPVPRLRRCFVCLIATIMSGTSSSSVPLLLVSRRHHIACRIVLLSHHHRCRRPLMRFIAIAPCTSSPSPRVPRRHHPAPCPTVAVTLRPSSPLPCTPRRRCPAPLVADVLLPLSHRPASPLARAPRR
jgi:hypothetical protein